MKLKHFLQLIIFFLCTCFAADFAFAENFSASEASAWVDGKGKQVIELLATPDNEKKLRQLDEILFNDVDLEYAARFVMGKYYKQMTPKQKETYFPLFKRYTSALYKNYPLQIKKGTVTYTVDKVITQKDSQFVHCTLYIKALQNNSAADSLNGVNLIFRLIKNAGKIQIRDLQVMESSFLSAYRQRFYKILHEQDDDDIDWFLEDLAAMVGDMERDK